MLIYIILYEDSKNWMKNRKNYFLGPLCNKIAFFTFISSKKVIQQERSSFS